MKRLLLLMLVTVLTLTASLATAAGKEIQDAGAIKSEAKRGFEEILDLWRAGNYAELYGRTTINGNDTKESFARRMSGAELKPSCCWEKMQEVAVNVKGPDSVVLKAKLGFDAPGETEFKTKAFKLYREDGVWRISRAELFSLAEAKKAKKSRKHHVKAIN
ncbi:MAG: hypothetical protein FIA91_12125 [Geobacter sp.]|nr:hypothetical protein [Geobacter sp.]